MNYRDLQNISNLSQQILVEGANEEHNVLNRWPYTSPYLQESTELDEASPSNPNLYTGRHGQTPTEYMAGRSDGGKRISGNEKYGPASYVSRFFKDAPTPPGAKPQSVKKLSSSEKDDLKYRKANFKLKSGGSTAQGVGSPSGTGRYTPGGGQGYGISGIKLADSYDMFDAILEYLVAEGYADTNESALVIMANMSEDWRQSIVEDDSTGATKTVGGQTFRDYNSDGLSDRQKRMKEFGEKRLRSSLLKTA